jgi:superfamily I DNA/RNA helicase
VAGDDDQAIFGWSGADVTSLLTLPGENVILDQSYRVPQAIHELSADIISRVRYRVDKAWKPMNVEGTVAKVFSLRSLDFEQIEGSWMVLASTNYMLNECHEHLRRLGLLFERNHVRSISEGTVEAVYNWERLCKGDSISAKEVKNIYGLLGPGMVARGYKKFDGPEDTLYTMEDLRRQYGLEVDAEWDDALARIPDQQRMYIRAALRRGQSLRGEPRIKLSTIHGSKGGEADNVALHMDLSTKFMDLYHERPDEVNRLFYVAVTRAKKNLFLILPKDYSKAFHI